MQENLSVCIYLFSLPLKCCVLQCSSDKDSLSPAVPSGGREIVSFKSSSEEIHSQFQH